MAGAFAVNVHGPMGVQRTVVAARRACGSEAFRGFRWERRLPNAACVVSLTDRVVVPAAGVLRASLVVPMVHRIVGLVTQGQDASTQEEPVSAGDEVLVEVLPPGLRFGWRTAGTETTWTETSPMLPGQSTLHAGRLCWRIESALHLERPTVERTQTPFSGAPCLAPIRLANRADDLWNVGELLLEFDGSTPRLCCEDRSGTRPMFFAPARRLMRDQDGRVIAHIRPHPMPSSQPSPFAESKARRLEAKVTLASKHASRQHAPTMGVTEASENHSNGAGNPRVFGGGAPQAAGHRGTLTKLPASDAPGTRLHD